MLAANRLTALVVDDNAHARAAAAACLRQLGVERISEAESGGMALAQLSTEACDLLLTDWYMPGMDGAALIGKLRASGLGGKATLPVLVMTAYPSQQTRLQARGLGVADVLIKPLTPAALAAALRRAVPEQAATTRGEEDDHRVFL